MPTADDLKRSRFLQQHEVDPPVAVTIKGYEEVNVARENAEPDMRWVFYMHEFLEKPMTMNFTNSEAVIALTRMQKPGLPVKEPGKDPYRDFDNWIGVKIVLYRDPTIIFGNKVVGGIRVQAPQQFNPAQAPPPQGGQPNPNWVGDNPPQVPEDSDVPF